MTVTFECEWDNQPSTLHRLLAFKRLPNGKKRELGLIASISACSIGGFNVHIFLGEGFAYPRVTTIETAKKLVEEYFGLEGQQ